MRKSYHIIRAILVLTISRTAVNMTRRFAYPFIPSIARQLSAPISSVQSVVALQGGAGLISPFFGPIAERFRRKGVMLFALVLMVIAAFIGTLAPTFGIFVFVMLTFGLGKTIFDPNMYAYLGDNVPYRRRGLALGVAEISWALGLFIAAPLTGTLLSDNGQGIVRNTMLQHSAGGFLAPLEPDGSGLTNVMLVLGIALLMAILLVWWFVPDGDTQRQRVRQSISPVTVFKVLRSSPAALGSVAYAFSLSLANEIIFINYGVFMENSFQLTLALLGSATIIISVAEVVGEFLIIFLADAFGKRLLALLGAFGAGLCYITLPFMDFSLPLALVVLFLMFVAVETAIVASLPLFTEVLPDNRAVMMSSAAGATAMGRVIGGVFGGGLYALTGDFLWVGFFALGINSIAVFSMWRFVTE